MSPACPSRHRDARFHPSADGRVTGVGTYVKKHTATGFACLACAALAAPVHAQHVPLPGIPGIDTEVGVELFGMPLTETLRSATANATRLRAVFSPLGHYELGIERRFGDAAAGPVAAVWGGVTTLERRRFYGWGNDTPAPLPASAYDIRPFQGAVQAGLLFERRGVRLALGPEFRYVHTSLEYELEDDGDGDADDPPLATPPAIAMFRPYGSGPFSQVAISGTLEARTAPPGPDTPAGAGIALGARWSPSALDVTSAYATVSAEAQGFLRLELPGEPLFAARVGAERASSAVPYFDAPHVGGYGRLRGYRSQRFTGTGAVWAGLENRVRLGRLSVRGRSIDFGTLAFADLGRVTMPDAGAAELHASWGGGVWVGLDGGPSASLTFADGDGTRLYLRLGLLDWR